MLQLTVRHHTALVRALWMGIFVILGSAVLHSMLASRSSSDRPALSLGYAPPALEAEKSAQALPDRAPADAPGPTGVQRANRHVEQRPPKQRLSELEKGRREVLTMITALMMQLQSTGAGGN
jgi:hypothetical protein